MEELKWMIPIERHLVVRTSFIKMFLRCPAQSMFRYFRGLVELPRSYTTTGTCTHKVAEHQNKYKLVKGRDEKLSTLQDVFNEEWRVRRGGTKWETYERPDEIKTHCLKRVLPVYYDRIAKRVEPLYVEKSFSLEFPKVNATITGTIDLVTRKHIIRDLKTKGRVPDWMDAFKSVQGISYWLGYEANFGRVPSGFILDYLIRTKTPRHEPSEMKVVKPHEIGEFIRLTENVILQLRQGLFYPKRENNHLCSPKFCGYWKRCFKGDWMNTPKDGKVFMGNDGKEST